MSEIRFPEFLASLENTRYPFVPTASLSNGNVAFLEGTFLDAHIYAIGGTDRYYISKVEVSSNQFVIVIGDSGTATRLTGTVPIPIVDSVVRLVDNNLRSGGVLVSESSRLALLAGWGIGTYTFERAQSEFCVTCQMPIPDPGVTSFRLEDGNVFSGQVWWVGDDGVVLSVETATDKNGESYDVVRVDVVGDPLFLERLCKPQSLFKPIMPIRKIRIINGDNIHDCTPNEQGNFNLQMNDALAADAALRVRTTSEGIVIEVAGSTPTV